MASARAALLRGAALLGAALLSCSFSDLASYPTKACDPRKPFASDDCAALAAPACQHYVCDPTSQCVLVRLDVDRDGDPPPACGGTDCDDDDPTNSGIGREACDAKDNNCNGLIDEGLFHDGPPDYVGGGAAPLAPTAEPSVLRTTTGSLAVTYVAAEADAGAATCLGTSQDPVSVFGNGCSPYGGAPEHAPRQPSSVVVPFTAALTTAYVTGTDCGSLAVRDTAGHGFELACGDSIRMPSLGVADVNSGELFAVYYDAPLSGRMDPTECAGAPRVPLYAADVMSRLLFPGARVAAPILLTSASAGFRPAALASVVVNGMLGPPEIVVAPDGDAVSTWDFGYLAGSFYTLVVTAHGTLPELAGATSAAVATAVRPDPGGPTGHFAVVSEIGCPPAARLTLVFGKLVSNGNGSVMAVDQSFAILLGGDQRATAPSVSWTDDGRYAEWRVSWLSAEGAMVQRCAASGGPVPEGTPIGAPFALSADPEAPPQPPLVAAPATDGHILTFSGGGVLHRHVPTCAP